MNETNITHLTFDCYGTLIDWERGILSAVQPWLAQHGVQTTPEVILQSFVSHEARLEAHDWQPYREVLRGVALGMAADFQVTNVGSAADWLVNSLRDWPPFSDTLEALRRLKERFRLVIISNTDDALFAQTRRTLVIPFDEVITAEQVRSYKPAKRHFLEAVKRLNVPVSQVMHVAQSLYHDHVPAQQLGFHTARIDRPSLLAGTGLAPAAQVQPHLTFPNLLSLADYFKVPAG